MALRRSAAKEVGLPSVVQVRLSPSPEQCKALSRAVTICNEAATRASRIAWKQRVFGQVALHHLVYRRLRAEFQGLGAQATVRAIARTAHVYARRSAPKKRAHIFRTHGAVPFDNRMLTFNRQAQCVSIWTPAGRVTVPYIGRAADLRAIRELPVGECDLIERGGKWLLHVAVTLPRPGVVDPRNGFLGVDQGVANLAVTSDGVVLPGPLLPGTVRSNGHVRGLRERRARQRVSLQRKATRSARRRLRGLSGRETRMMKDVNHQISKHVVREAERTGRGIALEDLRGIRGRVRAYRSQRRILHSWAFAQQVRFIRYKAVRVRIAFLLVDPAHTSQSCPRHGCGYRSKRNRPARGRFRCQRCGLAGHADHIAAINIAQRGADGWGAVNRPHATDLPSSRRAPESKPRSQAAAVD